MYPLKIIKLRLCTIYRRKINSKLLYPQGQWNLSQNLSQNEKGDSRADKVNRDGGWLSYPIPRAHGMMLRSDVRSWRNDKVCRADLFHPDRPQYYISEREYFELKRQQLDEMWDMCLLYIRT